MSHSFTHDGWTIIHNPDLSGIVSVFGPDTSLPRCVCDVPGEVLRRFLAHIDGKNDGCKTCTNIAVVEGERIKCLECGRSMPFPKPPRDSVAAAMRRAVDHLELFWVDYDEKYPDALCDDEDKQVASLLRAALAELEGGGR